MEDLLQVEIANLDQELSKLKSAVEYIETAKISIESASKIINTITKLKEEFGKLSEKAYLVIDKFDKMEIPSRLDNINSKIDSKVVSINSEIQTLQTSIETSNKVMLTEIKAISKHMSAELDDNKIKIFTGFQSQSKALKIIQYGLIGIFTLIVIFGAFVLMKGYLMKIKRLTGALLFFWIPEKSDAPDWGIKSVFPTADRKIRACPVLRALIAGSNIFR